MNAQKIDILVKEFESALEAIRKNEGYEPFITIFGEHIHNFLEKIKDENISLGDIMSLLQELRANISNSIAIKKTFIRDDENKKAILVAEKFIDALDKIIHCDSFRSLFDDDTDRYEENMTLSRIIIRSIKNIVEKNGK